MYRMRIMAHCVLCVNFYIKSLFVCFSQHTQFNYTYNIFLMIATMFAISHSIIELEIMGIIYFFESIFEVIS